MNALGALTLGPPPSASALALVGPVENTVFAGEMNHAIR